MSTTAIKLLDKYAAIDKLIELQGELSGLIEKITLSSTFSPGQIRSLNGAHTFLTNQIQWLTSDTQAKEVKFYKRD